VTAIDVGAPDTLTDVDPQIRVVGAPAGAPVTVRAVAVDRDGRAWRSSLDAATLEHDPLGLFWRLEPDDAVERFVVGWDGFEVRLSVDDGADVVLRRRFAAEGVTREEVSCGTLFVPAGDGPHPAVALFHGSGGGVAGLEPSGALLASHGVAALVVGWFSGDIRRVPVESLAQGVAFLRGDARFGSVSVVGTSAGGEAVATLVSTLDVEVDRVVLVAGSSVVWQALVDGRPPEESRFTLDGADLPYAPVVGTKLLAQMLVENPLRRLVGHAPELHTLSAYAAGLARPEAAAAALAVERCSAPMLLVAGADDEVWPAAEMAQAIVARRGRADDRLLVFPETGHISLRPPGLPTTVLRSGDLVFGGEPVAFASAMRATWSELLAFLAP
jgi:hypothetical protein